MRPTTGSGNQKTDQSPEASGGLVGTGGHVAVDYETVGWELLVGAIAEPQMPTIWTPLKRTLQNIRKKN